MLESVDVQPIVDELQRVRRRVMCGKGEWLHTGYITDDHWTALQSRRLTLEWVLRALCVREPDWPWLDPPPIMFMYSDLPESILDESYGPWEAGEFTVASSLEVGPSWMSRLRALGKSAREVVYDPSWDGELPPE
jgi:hypothetical protein